MKVFSEADNVGSGRKRCYSVSFHDGIATHRDGSPFFDLRLFHNKRSKDQFLRQLLQQGYCYAGNWDAIELARV